MPFSAHLCVCFSLIGCLSDCLCVWLSVARLGAKSNCGLVDLVWELHRSCMRDAQECPKQSLQVAADRLNNNSFSYAVCICRQHHHAVYLHASCVAPLINSAPALSLALLPMQSSIRRQHTTPCRESQVLCVCRLSGYALISTCHVA